MDNQDYINLQTDLINIFNEKTTRGAIVTIYNTNTLYDKVLLYTEQTRIKNFSERIYYILFEKMGICKTCGNKTNFIDFKTGYRTYCSKKCANTNSESSGHRKQTFLEKYGVDNPNKCPEVREKIKQTNLKRYGGTCSFDSNVLKEKSKQTCLEKYGVDHVMKVSSIKDKLKQSCFDIYGVDNVFKSEVIKDKIKSDSLEKYGVENPSQSPEAQEKKKQTNLDRYGVANPVQSKEIQEKIKQTNLERYGAESAFQNAEIQGKIKQNNLEKYGVERPLQNKEILEKTKQTCLENYGAENPFGSDLIQEKIKQTNLEIYYTKLLNSNRLKNLVKPLFLIHEYQGVKFMYNFQCIKCNNIFESHLDNGVVPKCLLCFPSSRSSYEHGIYDFLKLLNTQNIINNSRLIIPPLELDFYLPLHKLSFEFNGLYWHSELSGKDKNYHLNKTNACKAKGIHLIHIFEDEWIEKQEIVKSIIKSKLGLTDNKVHARKCEIREVSKQDACNFLFNNHLQVPIKSKHNFGLYFNKDLVYLISLSKPRFNKKYQFELIRSCPKINTSVPGGFSKLINHAIKTLNITSLISYVDRRYFDGKGYKDWKLVNETKPNYFYLKDYQVRESRIKYQKHKLKKLFPEAYDDNLTEWQIMQLAGYDRIWDCGNLVFSLLK